MGYKTRHPILARVGVIVDKSQDLSFRHFGSSVTFFRRPDIVAVGFLAEFGIVQIYPIITNKNDFEVFVGLPLNCLQTLN